MAVKSVTPGKAKAARETQSGAPATANAIIDDIVKPLFEDKSLYGYAAIDERLKLLTGFSCALVTLMPFPDMEKMYSPHEFYQMSEALGAAHALKMTEIKRRLEARGIKYAPPPAAPADDGAYRAEFSYKWAAVRAALGFIGKNDVFVHYKYGQRVRISCLLLCADVVTFDGDIKSECPADCRLCVDACPHACLTGRQWHAQIMREELINYKSCAAWSRHSGPGKRYLCCHCMMACPWPRFGWQPGNAAKTGAQGGIP